MEAQFTLNLRKDTTYEEIENFFLNFITLGAKRVIVFETSEFGSLLFEKIIKDFLDKSEFTRKRRHNIIPEATPYIEYRLANGVTIKIVVEEKRQGTDIELVLISPTKL